jgi:3-methyl-2-oxobutanoate hydroxymethyltransferase
MSMEKVTIAALQQMKRDGRKIVGVVGWDYQIAQIYALEDPASTGLSSLFIRLAVNGWAGSRLSRWRLRKL